MFDIKNLFLSYLEKKIYIFNLKISNSQYFRFFNTLKSLIAYTKNNDRKNQIKELHAKNKNKYFHFL